MSMWKKGIIITVTVNKEKVKYIGLLVGEKVTYNVVLLLRLTGARKALHFRIVLPSSELQIFFSYFLGPFVLLQDYIFITGISCLYGDMQARIFLAVTKPFDFLLEKDRTNSS